MAGGPGWDQAPPPFMQQQQQQPQQEAPHALMGQDMMQAQQGQPQGGNVRVHAPAMPLLDPCLPLCMRNAASCCTAGSLLAAQSCSLLTVTHIDSLRNRYYTTFHAHTLDHQSHCSVQYFDEEQRALLP